MDISDNYPKGIICTQNKTRSATKLTSREVTERIITKEPPLNDQNNLSWGLTGFSVKVKHVL